MTGIIGKKIGMTTIYDEQDRSVPCTLVEINACSITQLKTVDTDGYMAVQLGFGDKKEKHTTNPLMGHFKKANLTPKRKLFEFRYSEQDLKEGKEFTLGQEVFFSDIFSENDFVDVTSISKGKGHGGVMKRHGFSGVGGRSHGQHNRERAAGSIGASSFPSRVFKGMRMAGRTGGQKVKIKNLRVVRVLAEHRIVVLSGSLPGANGAYVVITK